MIVDYSTLDSNTLRSVNIIETKSHARYIRYLLSKRIPPTTIRKELARLALSAPDKATLVNYFNAVFIPKIEALGLREYYAGYIHRLEVGENEDDVSPVLRFSLAFGNDDAARVAFCALIREIEVEEMWSREITRYYGGIHNIPQNEAGERIIHVNPARSVEAILTCPRKYIIDKLLLENVSPARIAKYMWDKYQIKIEDTTFYTYAKYFFNFERKEIEEVLEQLLAEQTSIKSDLEILESNETYSLGDKLAISRQYSERLTFLEDSIKDLNARYTDLTFQQGVTERLNTQDIVDDIIQRGYERLKFLDRYRDRDVVKPLTDVSKMIFSAIDKRQQMEETAVRIKKTVLDRDKGAQETLITLYQESYDRHIAEMEAKAGLPATESLIEDVEAIEGLDEV